MKKMHTFIINDLKKSKMHKFSQGESCRQLYHQWNLVLDNGLFMDAMGRLHEMDNPDFVIRGLTGYDEMYINEYRHEYVDSDPFLRIKTPAYLRIKLSDVEKSEVYSAILKNTKRLEWITAYGILAHLKITIPDRDRQAFIDGLYGSGRPEYKTLGEPSVHVAIKKRSERNRKRAVEKQQDENSSKRFMIEPISYGPISSCRKCGGTPEAYFRNPAERRRGYVQGRLIVVCGECSDEKINQEYVLTGEKCAQIKNGTSALTVELEKGD